MFDIKKITSTDNVLEITDESQWDWWTRRQEETRVHHATKCIPLRFTEEAKFFRDALCDNYVKYFPAYAIYKPFLDEYLDLLSEHYKWTNYIAILTKMPGGSGIKKHRDQGKWLQLAHRIHMPVVTNPQVKFSCGGTVMNMKRGVFYEINNVKLHGVRNDSKEDRIHLIIDLLPS